MNDRVYTKTEPRNEFLSHPVSASYHLTNVVEVE